MNRKNLQLVHDALLLTERPATTRDVAAVAKAILADDEPAEQPSMHLGPAVMASQPADVKPPGSLDARDGFGMSAMPADVDAAIAALSDPDEDAQGIRYYLRRDVSLVLDHLAALEQRCLAAEAAMDEQCRLHAEAIERCLAAEARAERAQAMLLDRSRNSYDGAYCSWCGACGPTWGTDAEDHRAGCEYAALAEGSGES